MKRDMLKIIVPLFAAVICTSSMGVSAQTDDDLYYRGDKLSKKIDKEERQSQREPKDEVYTISGIDVSSESVDRAAAEAKPGDLITSYEVALNRRIAAMTASTDNVPQSYWDYLEKYAEILATKYDSELYNIVIIGKDVWVEPKYLTAMFDGTTDLTIKTKEVKPQKSTQTKVNVNINLGYDWYPYNWGYSPYWGGGYWGSPYWGNPYWGGGYWGRPGWGWGWGYNPWYSPYYYHGYHGHGYYGHNNGYYNGRDVMYGSRRGGVDGGSYNGHRPTVGSSAVAGTGYRNNIRREAVGGPSSPSGNGYRRPAAGSTSGGSVGTGTGYRRPASTGGSNITSPTKREPSVNKDAPARRDSYERQTYDRPTYSGNPAMGGGNSGGNSGGSFGGGGGGGGRGGRR